MEENDALVRPDEFQRADHLASCTLDIVHRLDKDIRFRIVLKERAQQRNSHRTVAHNYVMILHAKANLALHKPVDKTLHRVTPHGNQQPAEKHESDKGNNQRRQCVSSMDVSCRAGVEDKISQDKLKSVNNAIVISSIAADLPGIFAG